MADWALTRIRTAILDLNKLAGRPGCALGLVLKLHCNLTVRQSLNDGYGMLAGVIDSDYNWYESTLNDGLLAVGYQFQVAGAKSAGTKFIDKLSEDDTPHDLGTTEKI